MPLAHDARAGGADHQEARPVSSRFEAVQRQESVRGPGQAEAWSGSSPFTRKIAGCVRGQRRDAGMAAVLEARRRSARRRAEPGRGDGDEAGCARASGDEADALTQAGVGGQPVQRPLGGTSAVVAAEQELGERRRVSISPAASAGRRAGGAERLYHR